MALASGKSLAVGFHIRSASSLTFIQANPSDVTLTQEGQWDSALAGADRQHFAMQPYAANSATLLSETQAMEAFATEVASGPSTDPIFYIYQGWPSLTQIAGAYQAYWSGSVVNDDLTLMIGKRQAFDYLYTRLNAALADPVRMIPTGEILYQIDIAARAGQLPGISTVGDIYRDDAHMGDVGHFAAAAAIFSVIYGEKMDSDATYSLHATGDGSVTLTQALADAVNDIVWLTVTADARTGV